MIEITQLKQIHLFKPEKTDVFNSSTIIRKMPTRLIFDLKNHPMTKEETSYFKKYFKKGLWNFEKEYSFIFDEFK
jgi:hypothetical protein